MNAQDAKNVTDGRCIEFTRLTREKINVPLSLCIGAKVTTVIYLRNGNKIPTKEEVLITKWTRL